MVHLKILIPFLFCHSLYAQPTSTSQSPQKADSQALQLPTVKLNIEDPRIAEAHNVLDEVKAGNPPDLIRLEMKSGIMQIVANSVDGLDLNAQKTIPYVGADGTIKIYGPVAFEGRYFYSQNLLLPPEPGSKNGTGAKQTSYDAGLRYTVILDNTRTEDFFAAKLLYHNMTNNFKTDDDTKVFVTNYTSYIMGIERSIPVTPKIGILASLDIHFINSIKSESRFEMLNSGNGFQMRGQVNYKVDWFGVPSRLGANYWQGGYVNRFTPASQKDLTRTSHVQTFRAVGLNYIMFY